MPIEVTPQKSAEINARIGQVCRTAASGRELTAQLNREFGLDWHPNTYRRRARDAGYRWPGRKVRRLTPEESEKMDRRLRELCEAGIPGTEIRKILNNEFELPWGLHAYIQRAKRLDLHWTETPLTGRPWPGVEYLPEDQRAACYEDPAYEARQKIADRSICRECFAMLCRDGAMDGKEGHLWKMHRKILGCDDPEKIVHRYRLRSPGARLFSFQRIANDRSRDVNELMAEFAELYVTPEVLAAANSDPEYEDKHMPKYVICRELRCGFKSVGALHGHLESQHDIKDIDKWRREHNWAPIIAPAAARKKAEELSDRNKKLRKRAWRPADWKDWPVWQKAVGMLIIENTSLEPREIGIHMDDSRTQFRWPEEWKYDSWERNFTKTGPGATWISKIRTKIRDELR